MAAKSPSTTIEYPGWRPARRWELCPRWVLRRPCRAHHPRYGGGLCRNALLTHAHAWTDGRGGRVLSIEPYHVNSADLARLVTACRREGLRVRLHPKSPHSPGYAALFSIVVDGRAG